MFVCSLVPCNVRQLGRSLKGRLQVMGRSVRQHAMQLRLAMRFAVLGALRLVSGAVATTSAQVELPEVEIDPIGLVIGGAAGIAVGRGESFDGMSAGYDLHLFLGSTLKTVSELRAGIAMSSFPDDESAVNAEILSIYLETYFRRAISHFTVGVGPRIAWMQHSRTIFGSDLRSFDFGGVASAQLLLGSRKWLETGITFTSVSFDRLRPDSGILDADRRNQGALWELRLGMAFRVK